jgi:hypothetical protein
VRFYDFFQGVCGKSHICRVSVHAAILKVTEVYMPPTTRGHPGSSKKSTEEMELLPYAAKRITVLV